MFVRSLSVAGFAGLKQVTDTSIAPPKACDAVDIS